MEKYKQLFAKKINPLLYSHNGWAEVLDVKDGELILKMRGACSSCLSVHSTVDHFITNVVKENCPEIEKILLSDEPDPELWDMAKKILNHKTLDDKK